jgi:hypothetical protein
MSEEPAQVKQVVYNQTTGVIWFVMTLPETLAGYSGDPDYQGLVLPLDTVVASDTHYVSDGALAARIAMTPTVSKTTLTADGTDAVTISGLPDPCTVAITGAISVAATTVTGGSITLTSNTVGAIRVRVTADPQYLAWSTDLNAV